MLFTLVTHAALLSAFSKLDPVSAQSSSTNSTLASLGSSNCWCRCPRLFPTPASSGFPSAYPSASTLSYPNVTSNGNKTSWNYTSSLSRSLSHPSQTPVSLIPAVHPDVDTTEMRNLAPRHGQEMYYASDSATPHTFAHLTTNTSFPSVQLAHSAYISSVNPTPRGLHVQFISPAALAYAEAAWSRAYPFVLVTTPEQTTKFHIVTHYETRKEDNSIRVLVEEELPVQEALPEVQISIGSNIPSVSTASSFISPNIVGSGGAGNLTHPLNSTSLTPTNSTVSNSTHPSTQVPLNINICGPPPSASIPGFASTAVCDASPTIAQKEDGSMVCSWSCERQGYGVGLGIGLRMRSRFEEGYMGLQGMNGGYGVGGDEVGG